MDLPCSEQIHHKFNIMYAALNSMQVAVDYTDSIDRTLLSSQKCFVKFLLSCSYPELEELTNKAKADGALASRLTGMQIS